MTISEALDKQHPWNSDYPPYHFETEKDQKKEGWVPTRTSTTVAVQEAIAKALQEAGFKVKTHGWPQVRRYSVFVREGKVEAAIEVLKTTEYKE